MISIQLRASRSDTWRDEDVGLKQTPLRELDVGGRQVCAADPPPVRVGDEEAIYRTHDLLVREAGSGYHDQFAIEQLAPNAVVGAGEDHRRHPLRLDHHAILGTPRSATSARVHTQRSGSRCKRSCTGLLRVVSNCARDTTSPQLSVMPLRHLRMARREVSGTCPGHHLTSGRSSRAMTISSSSSGVVERNQMRFPSRVRSKSVRARLKSAAGSASLSKSVQRVESA